MNKTFKKIISLVLVVVMVISTMTVSVVSTSAASEKSYVMQVRTAGHDGVSGDIFTYKIIGTKDSVSFKFTTASLRETTQNINCADLGEIKSVEVSHWAGCNDLYINWITIREIGGTSTTFYGGRWVDKKLVLTKSDNVYKVRVNTGTDTGAGTNLDVYINIFDKNNKSTGQINATKIHSDIDAFEKGDKEDFYIYAPSDFGELSGIEFDLNLDKTYYTLLPYLIAIEAFTIEWTLASVSAEKVSGNTGVGNKYSKNINEKLNWDDLYKVYF